MSLEQDILQQVASASDEAALEAVRVATLGKKGSISEQMKAKTTLKVHATEENLELQITEFQMSQKASTAMKNLRAAILQRKQQLL